MGQCYHPNRSESPHILNRRIYAPMFDFLSNFYQNLKLSCRVLIDIITSDSREYFPEQACTLQIGLLSSSCPKLLVHTIQPFFIVQILISQKSFCISSSTSSTFSCRVFSTYFIIGCSIPTVT